MFHGLTILVLGRDLDAALHTEEQLVPIGLVPDHRFEVGIVLAPSLNGISRTFDLGADAHIGIHTLTEFPPWSPMGLFHRDYGRFGGGSGHVRTPAMVKVAARYTSADCKFSADPR